MPQVRIPLSLANEVRAAVPDTDSLARAVEIVLVRGLTLDLDEPEPAAIVVENPAPSPEPPPPGRASVRRPKRGPLW